MLKNKEPSLTDPTDKDFVSSFLAEKAGEHHGAGLRAGSCLPSGPQPAESAEHTRVRDEHRACTRVSGCDGAAAQPRGPAGPPVSVQHRGWAEPVPPSFLTPRHGRHPSPLPTGLPGALSDLGKPQLERPGHGERLSALSPGQRLGSRRRGHGLPALLQRSRAPLEGHRPVGPCGEPSKLQLSQGNVTLENQRHQG